MSETRARPTDPRLLLEAARVFNAAGADYKTVAEVVAESAVQARDNADSTIRDAIIGDGAALRLSGRVPGGYRAALELLNEMGPDADGRLHLLRALANGQKYKEARLSGKSKDDPELIALRGQIRDDLTFAFAQNDRLKAANQHFWRPTASALATVGGREDDLWAVYEDDPEFRKVVDLPAAGAPSATSGGATGAASATPGGATGAASATPGGATGAASPTPSGPTGAASATPGGATGAAGTTRAEGTSN